jgi:hypothetical protein
MVDFSESQKQQLAIYRERLRRVERRPEYPIAPPPS